jgi:beta-lactamase superfamily II metal-dependent hydrolase
MLKLHVIQATHGDCLLLEMPGHGAGLPSRHVLIDGGPPRTYARHLKPVLKAIAAGGGGRLDLVILSHIDDDHVGGLLALTADLRKQHARAQEAYIKIDQAWHNGFSPLAGLNPDLSRGLRLSARMRTLAATASARTSPTPSSSAALRDAARSIRQGDQLMKATAELGIPLNAGFTDGIVAVGRSAQTHRFGALRLHVVGPTHQALEALREEWLEWIARQEAAVTRSAAIPVDLSVPNLSSIVVVAEMGGHRILFTGDARGDQIVEGLREAGLAGTAMTERQAVAHFDVLKLPHHGSKRNVSREFFHQVTADRYIISASGRHDNPDPDTLAWLVEAARDQQREIEILATNDTPALRQLVSRYPPEESGYRLSVLDRKSHALVIDLAE